MRTVKAARDPKGIMNPGKVLCRPEPGDSTGRPGRILGNCAEEFPRMNMIQQPAAMPAVAKRAGRTLAEVAAEIERRVADAPVRSEPFPHLLIDDLLPGVVRDALDRHWPGRDRFRASNLASRGALRISRLADSGEDRDRRFWSAMRRLASRGSGERGVGEGGVRRCR